MRNISVFTLVSPERLRMIQYSPYPPTVDKTTSQVIAAQNVSSEGGFAAPALMASAVKTAALVRQCVVIATAGATCMRERRSRNVAALFTDLARDIASDQADQLGRTLMLLHEGALVAHGLSIFPDPISHAREKARVLVQDHQAVPSITNLGGQNTW